ncbi:hypothetical protein K435DRAFT_868966 [Dendrothele bispora CBS 962.96]|uniref:Uncharacterized protein n=1 Tax=Dendrothele bispora (strain CBS 962.96) TaxID=1314807 RepID=A0A4S8LBS2_DENBC|nr:hypothetical protein K435DRAFT_868966 [Dendrothele bispora CBS 962.96]
MSASDAVLPEDRVLHSEAKEYLDSLPVDKHCLKLREMKRGSMHDFERSNNILRNKVLLDWIILKPLKEASVAGSKARENKDVGMESERAPSPSPNADQQEVGHCFAWQRTTLASWFKK